MEHALATLRLLIDADSPLEHIGAGGRTALYLAAEFWPVGPEAVQLLIDAGAQPDVCDAHGNHIVENAWSPQVKTLLSALTGHAIPAVVMRKPDRKMSAAAWKLGRARIDAGFAALKPQASSPLLGAAIDRTTLPMTPMNFSGSAAAQAQASKGSASIPAMT